MDASRRISAAVICSGFFAHARGVSANRQLDAAGLQVRALFVRYKSFVCAVTYNSTGDFGVSEDLAVRFIYVRPRDWYLSIDVERRRDVIERPLENDVDLAGWDLRKALNLFVKSNPPLLEWLVSSIVYLDRNGVRDGLRELLPDYYSPVACAHHYLHMAHNNYREFFNGPMVKQKKYFYVLRPIFAIEWIARGYGPVPMEFATLVERIVPSGALADEIQKLLEAKRAGVEMGLAPRNDVVCDFVASELERFQTSLPSLEPAHGQSDVNALFRRVLDQVYQ